MKKILDFLKRPRNVYFSIIVMLTVVTGLVSISFSYYVDESTNSGIIRYSAIDNRLQSDDLEDGYLTLAAHETKPIKVYVMSNNNFESKFKIYYKTDDNIQISSEVILDETIDSKEVYAYDLYASNFGDKESKVFIGISNAYLDEEVVFDGEEISIFE